MVVAHNVREIRESQGLSQLALAARMGVHRNTIMNIEKPVVIAGAKIQNISLETLDALAAGLGVTPQRLLLPLGSRLAEGLRSSLDAFLAVVPVTPEERALLEGVGAGFGVPSHRGWMFFLEALRDARRGGSQ